VVVACWEDVPSELDLRAMLTGKGVILSSQFRLTYSMILNLLRVEDLKVRCAGLGLGAGGPGGGRAGGAQAWLACCCAAVALAHARVAGSSSAPAP
jgi:hypothetical protein